MSRTEVADGQMPSRLDPLGRLALLCDPGSLEWARPPVASGPVGVLAATGRVRGRPVVCYAQDSALAGGSVGTAEADTVVRALRLARHTRAPLVAFLESAGARLQEGAAALGGFRRIFYENVSLSGRAPQISVVTGTSAGGGCYSPALTDFIVMTRPSAMFLTGPRVVRAAVGEEVSAEALGGPDVHQRNGVCHFVADDDREAVAVVRELLGYLPPERVVTDEPSIAPTDADPGRHVPAAPRKVYDIRDVVRDIVDDGRLLEVSPRWSAHSRRRTVVLRKAYGGAYITMNAKDLGADLALAWTGAQIGIMGSQAAIQIIHRRELAEAPGSAALADELAADYAARHIAADRALELGLIDAVIHSGETRGRLTVALHSMLADRRASGRRRPVCALDSPVIQRDGSPTT